MIMKRVFKFFAGLLVLLSNAPAKAQPVYADNCLLWQISGKGLTKPSYLFGTIHLICPTDFFWTETLKKSLDKSDKLCLEMDMDDMGVMMTAAAGFMDKTGKKLHEYFTPDQYTLLSNYVKDSLGMNIASFEMMKPIALQSLMAIRSTTCDDAVSYEDTIMKVAVKQKKEVLGLETPEEQITALESIPIDSVISGLMDAIENKNDDKKEYAEMVAAYKIQDITKLHTMIVQSEEYGELTNTLIDVRNKKWIDRMSGMMNKSSVFFAVGAGHLWGDSGVIKLLRAQGYKVEPQY